MASLKYQDFFWSTWLGPNCPFRSLTNDLRRLTFGIKLNASTFANSGGSNYRPSFSSTSREFLLGRAHCSLNVSCLTVRVLTLPGLRHALSQVIGHSCGWSVEAERGWRSVELYRVKWSSPSRPKARPASLDYVANCTYGKRTREVRLFSWCQRREGSKHGKIMSGTYATLWVMAEATLSLKLLPSCGRNPEAEQQ